MRIVKHSNQPIDITFIVTTYNEEKYLPVCLGSIAGQQTELVGEIIVVDDFSVDRSIAIAEEYGASVLISPEKSNVTKMRNLGLAHARGTAILFVDADVAFTPNYVEEMAGPIVRDEVDATLSFIHYPLEVEYPVFPDDHAKSYVWCLQHLPRAYWAKYPVRWLRWVPNWLRAMRRKKRWCSIMDVPDRVHTSAIVARTAITRQFGGWHKPFGAHNNTEYCFNVFAHTDRVRWMTRPHLYLSQRRWFPTDNSWILQRHFRLLYKLCGMHKRDMNTVYDPNGKGYRDAAGRR